MKKIWNSLFFVFAFGLTNTVLAQSLNLRLPNRLGTSMLVIEENRASPSNTLSDYQRAQEHCFGTATILFGHSNHPDGGHNERNGGNGGRCYLNPERTSYALVVALQNSQYGNTLVFAYGRRFSLLTLETSEELFPQLSTYLKRVQLSVGIEAGSLYYEKRFGRGAVTAPFVFPHVALNFSLGKNIEMSAMQLFLPDRIKLWGHVIDVPPEFSGNYEFFGHEMGYQSDRQPHFRPMIFLRYSF